MKSIFAFLLFFVAIKPSITQNTVLPTSALLRLEGFERRKNLLENNLEPRSIGPTVFSCRVTDIDVNPLDPTQFLVGYSSGGLWKTTSNGSDFTPIFDHEASMTIGDVAADWSKNIIWVGTGESNSSRSSYSGTGMYYSADGGKNWESRGLVETQHIGRVLLHPTDPEVVWVAAVGHLYSPNQERGVYKTVDGGKNWKQILFVNENTGAIDLMVDPSNSNILWASMWERERRAWFFKGNGSGSGIYKSTDGGDNWTKISGGNSGFPEGEKMGRIGLDIFQKEGKTVLYASLDNQTSVPKKEDENENKDLLKKAFFKDISTEQLLEIPDEQLADFLKNNDFPDKYDAKTVKKQVKSGKISATAIYDFLDAGDDGFQNTGIVGLEIYRSEDGGTSWFRTHEKNLDNVTYTYGYYFGVVRVNKNDPNQVYTMGVPLIKSADGGKNWRALEDENAHGDHHVLWIDPNRAGHLINGNDGGINISYDDGKTWFKCNSPAVAQFYSVNVDNEEIYNVYGGLQDNGVWYGSSKSEVNREWHASGQNPFKFIYGGDGMQVQVDTRDNNTVYTGSQFGQYGRVNRTTGETDYITPSHDLGEKPLRFNWETPILLSNHNQDVLYFGANRLFRSLDKGKNWIAISGDLTGGGQKGNVPYGTLTAIHESPLKFGLIYTGSDDGLVFCSNDGGETWVNVSDGLPQNMWVSRVQASAHEKNRVYLTLNGYRWDDFTSYIYVSENMGKNWSAIGADLPAEPINVVKEDPINPDLLFVGTDNGVYFSQNRGQNFQKLSKNLPAVSVHDLAIQKNAKELVIGTHGRALYIQSIANLQQLTVDKLAENIVLFDIKKKRWSSNWGKQNNQYTDIKQPELAIDFYVKTIVKVNYSIKTKDGLVVEKGVISADAGYNSFKYNLQFDPKNQVALEKELTELTEKAVKNDKPKKPISIKKSDSGHFYLAKGSYLVELEAFGQKVSQEFLLEGGR